MLTKLFPLVLLMAGHVFASARGKAEGGKYISVSMLFSIFFLYIFYILNLLSIGFYALVGIFLALYAAAGVLMVQQFSKEYLAGFIKRLFSPSALCFAGLYVFFYFVTKEQIVCLWDELRLWGAYPKALFYTDALQLGEGSMVYASMQSYPPSMPLFCYFILKASNVFWEGGIFLSYAVFCAALFLPMLDACSWKQSWKIILYVFFIIIAPLMIYSNNGSGYYDHSDFYVSLYIDCVVGIMGAAVLYYAIKTDDKKPIDVLLFCLSCFVVTGLKESAILFSASAILLLCAALWTRKENLWKHLKKPVFLLSIVSVLFPYFSWKQLIAGYGLRNIVLESYNAPDAGRIRKFLKEAFTAPVHESGFSAVTKFFSLPAVMLFILILALFLYKLLGAKAASRRVKIGIMGMACVNILYAVGLYSFYTGVFTTGFPSYPRYAGTILAADVAFLGLMFFDHFLQGKIPFSSQRPWFKALMACMLIALLICLPLKQPVKFNGGWDNDAREQSENILTGVRSQQDPGEGEEPVDVYFLLSGNAAENAGLHHRIYYNLMGENIRIVNYYEQMDPVARYKAPEKWLQHLSGVQYVYIYNTDEGLLTTFADLFDQTPEPKTIYAVDEGAIYPLTLIEQ